MDILSQGPKARSRECRSMALTKFYGHETDRKSQWPFGDSGNSYYPGDPGILKEPWNSARRVFLGHRRTCALVHAMLSLADLQLQPAGWLCPSSIDKGPPQALLTVRGVARWAPVDEVP